MMMAMPGMAVPVPVVAVMMAAAALVALDSLLRWRGRRGDAGNAVGSS
jgi:hypothetical protein